MREKCIASTCVLMVVGLLLSLSLVSGCRTTAHDSDGSTSVSTSAATNAPDGWVAGGEIGSDQGADLLLRPAQGDAARLRPGLVVNVQVLVAGKKEIDAGGQRVTDKGTIAMPLLGTVDVQDQTLDDVGVKLTAGYKEYFVNPQVVVAFVSDDSREGQSPWGNVTVLGRVRKSGKISIPATRDLTLSAAIQQAGGFDTSAKQSAIRITRRVSGGKTNSREVNFKSVGAQGRVEDDIQLEPDDVVFVPELVF